jgi:hypothetical protein
LIQAQAKNLLDEEYNVATGSFVTVGIVKAQAQAR